MTELLYILNALNIFYKSCHWRCQGDFFYQDHLLFERLYDGIDGEMDGLVELIIGLTNDRTFADARIINEKTQIYTPSYGENNQENFTKALQLENSLLSSIAAIPQSSDVGLYNHIATIADNHRRKVYLLKSSLSK